jgi:hypothetical protein
MFHVPAHKSTSAGSASSFPLKPGAYVVTELGVEEIDVRPVADFEVKNCGSIWLLKPVSQAAQDWCAVYLPADAPMWVDSFAVEPRCLEAIIAGFEMDGLTW